MLSWQHGISSRTRWRPFEWIRMAQTATAHTATLVVTSASASAADSSSGKLLSIYETASRQSRSATPRTGSWVGHAANLPRNATRASVGVPDGKESALLAHIGPRRETFRALRNKSNRRLIDKSGRELFRPLRRSGGAGRRQSPQMRSQETSRSDVI